MPEIYTQDLRDRAISNWQKTGNKSKKARLFEINRNTLDQWINLYQEQGNNQPKPFAPVTFEGVCNRVTVEDWLHTLAQSLPKDKYGHYPKRILVLDNARFHHGGDLKQIAEPYNFTLIYLPPYSLELNPIEQ